MPQAAWCGAARPNISWPRRTTAAASSQAMGCRSRLRHRAQALGRRSRPRHRAQALGDGHRRRPTAGQRQHREGHHRGIAMCPELLWYDFDLFPPFSRDLLYSSTSWFGLIHSIVVVFVLGAAEKGLNRPRCFTSRGRCWFLLPALRQLHGSELSSPQASSGSLLPLC